MTSPLEWAILLPFGAAILAAPLGRRASHVFGVGISLVLVGVAVWLAATVWREGPIDYAVGGWDVPLGIRLHADGLSALMLVMTAGVSAPIALYATRYFRASTDETGWSEHQAYLPLWLMVVGSLNVLFVSGDVFNLYVALELLTLSGVGLVVLAGGDAVVAGMRYLLAMFFASIFYLAGVVFLYAQFNTLDIGLLGERFGAGLILAGAWRRLVPRRLSRVEIPAGDIVGPFERLGGGAVAWVRHALRVSHEKSRAGIDLPAEAARAIRLEHMVRFETHLSSWAVLGYAIVALAALVAILLSHG